MERLKRHWPVALALGLAFILAVGVGSFSVGMLDLLILAGLTVAWGAMVAGFVVLILGIVKRFRGDREWVHDRPTIGWLAILVALGLMGAWSAIMLGSGFGEGPVMGIVFGLVLLAVGARHALKPFKGGIIPVVLILAMIASVDIPRSEGLLRIHWDSSSANWSTNANRGENCNGFNMGDTRMSLSHAQRYVIDASALSGDIGERLYEIIGPPPSEYDPDRVDVRVSGHITTGVGCYMPLYRTGSDSASLTALLDYHWREGERSMTCNGSSNLTITYDTSMFGVASCYDFRDYLARMFLDRLHEEARAAIWH